MTHNYLDFLGKTFHYLTVISNAGIKKYGKRNLSAVLCKCKCGSEQIYPISSLKTGRSKSCGCFSAELNRKRLLVHGLAKHPLYNIWFSMINRCENLNDDHYSGYGGRGISVCNEWKNNVIAFYNWCLSNGWQQGLEIDRRDNDGNYSPGNCRFVTRKVNCRNKRDNRIIEYQNEKKTFIEWSEYFGLSRSILKDRINKLKWPLEKAFTTPPIYHYANR